MHRKVEQKKNIAILWDFDNTLARRDGMWTSCLYELLIEHGITRVSKEAISPHMQHGFPWQQYEIPHQMLFEGKSWWAFMEDKLRQILATLRIEPSVSSDIAKSFRARYLDLQYWHLYEDTLETLATSTESGYTNFILSNHTPELAMIVEGLGISRYIKSTFSSGLIGYDKPHFKIFQFALSNIPESHSKIMIGDNYVADIVGARSNGMPGILVRSENKFNHDFYSKELKPVLDMIPIVLKKSTS